jgi:hypothetical protein
MPDIRFESVVICCFHHAGFHHIFTQQNIMLAKVVLANTINQELFGIAVKPHSFRSFTRSWQEGKTWSDNR